MIYENAYGPVIGRPSRVYKSHKQHHAMSDMPYILDKGLRFITNFDREDESFYHDVIQVFWKIDNPNTIFYMSEYATDVNGNRIKCMKSLWSNIRRYNDFHEVWVMCDNERDKNAPEPFIKITDFHI